MARKAGVWLGAGVMAALLAIVLWRSGSVAQVGADGVVAQAPRLAGLAEVPAQKENTQTNQGRPAQAGRVKDFEALKARARAGDAVAQRKLAEAYDACFLVNLDRAAFIDGLEFNRRTINNPAHLRVLERIVRERVAQCDAVDGGAIVPTQLIRGWYAQAAANGDLPARLMDNAFSLRRSSAAESARLLEDVMSSNDPAAVLAFGNTMWSNYTVPPGDPAEALVRGELANWSWMVAACRMGYDCGPDSTVMGNMCLQQHACAGEDFETYFKRELGSDAQRRDLERRVTDILRVVEGQ